MSDDLRTVARFATPTEAAVARNALEAAGIAATIADELTLTADPLFSGAVGYIKVQVRETDLERAAEVLADAGGSDELEPGDEGDEFPPVSPGERLVEFAYRAALMGILACPPLLHLYSLGLLLWVGAVHGNLPPAANRKYWIALIVDLAVIGMATLLVRAVVGS
jgi:hypothetical protein